MNKIAELEKLLSDMSFPPTRLKMRDWPWFLRNLGISEGNRANPNFEKAMELIKELHRASM